MTVIAGLGDITGIFLTQKTQRGRGMKKVRGPSKGQSLAIIRRAKEQVKVDTQRLRTELSEDLKKVWLG